MQAGVYVPPIGPKDAKIAFVGEAPGLDEEKAVEPFVGASGRILTDTLARLGIRRSDVYITNLCKYRPPRNDFSFFYDDGEKRQQPSAQLLHSIEEVHEELRRVKPNIIVPLGGEPLKAITGRSGITKWRGSILSSKLGKVVSTFHPAAILRSYGDKPIFELDLRRVKVESVTPALNLPKHNFIFAPSKQRVLEWLRELKPGHRLSFDIETLSNGETDPAKKSFFVRCLGLSRSVNEAIIIPFMSLPGQYIPGSGIIPTVEGSGEFNNFYSEDDEYEILQALDAVFLDDRIEKTAQNAPFDMVRLAKQFGIRVRGLVLDTMLGWHALYPELPKGLDFLASVLTRVPYYSDHDNASDYDEWKYCGYDACVTLEASYSIERELQNQNLWEPYCNHVQPSMVGATRTENRGFKIDLAKRKEMEDQTVAEVERLRRELAAIVGNPDFNPNSTQQCQGYFYDVLKLPRQYASKRKPDGSRPVTFDKNARDFLAKKFPQHAGVLRLVDEFSAKETLLTGFLRRPVRSDGRMYTHLNVGGTVTRRVASSDPGDEPGTNLQNLPIRPQIAMVDGKMVWIPSYIRDLFIAEEGRSLIKADLSAAEYMHVMWRANVQRVIQRFLENLDFSPHRWMASQMFNIPEDQVSKKSREYSNAKNGNYGGNYGMMPARAAVTWKVTELEAKFIMEKYHSLMPEIQGVYWPMISRMIDTSRTVWSPSGLRRMFFDRIELGGGLRQTIYRDAYSHDAQSHVADLINRAWHLMDASFPEDECHVILQVHDELVLSCRTELVPKYAPLVKRFMEYPVTFPGTPQPLTIPAEVTYGPTWLQQQPFKEAA